MAEKRRTSPWLWVGCGCAGALVLLAVAAGAFLYFGYRAVKSFEAEMEDPDARAARVQRVLGYERPPAGYHPMMGLSLPFLMEMAILSDREPPAEGDVDDQGFGERGFIYVEMLTFGPQSRELEDFFEGRTDDPEALRRANVSIGRGEILHRGSFRLEDLEVRYLTQRGGIDMRHGGGHDDGLTTLAQLRCPGDRRQRMGIWFGPDPDPTPGPEASPTDLTGTVGDESELRAFLGHFQLCG